MKRKKNAVSTLFEYIDTLILIKVFALGETQFRKNTSISL